MKQTGNERGQQVMESKEQKWNDRGQQMIDIKIQGINNIWNERGQQMMNDMGQPMRDSFCME